MYTQGLKADTSPGRDLLVVYLRLMPDHAARGKLARNNDLTFGSGYFLNYVRERGIRLYFLN